MSSKLRGSARVYRRLSEGASLHTISREADEPSLAQMRKWLIDSEEFRERYLVAREVHAERLRDDMRRIAGDLKNATDPVRIDSARLRVEVYKDAVAAVERDCARVRGGGKRPREKAEVELPPLPIVRFRYV